MNASPSDQHPLQHMAASATAVFTRHELYTDLAAPRPDVTKPLKRLDNAGLMARYRVEKCRRNGLS